MEKGDSFYIFQKSVPQWIELFNLLPSPFLLMPKRKFPPFSPRLNIGFRESLSGNFPSTYIPQRYPPSCILTIFEQMFEFQKRAIEYTSENDRPTKKPRWIKWENISIEAVRFATLWLYMWLDGISLTFSRLFSVEFYCETCYDIV